MSNKTTDVEKARRKSVMEEFGKWLRFHRVTQREAAEKLGIYHGYLSNLVTGKQIPSLEITESAEKEMCGNSPLLKVSGQLVPAIVENSSKANDKFRRCRPYREGNVGNQGSLPQKDAMIARSRADELPRYWNSLPPAAIKAVGDIAVSYINNHPTLDTEQLLLVIKGIRDGFAADT